MLFIESLDMNTSDSIKDILIFEGSSISIKEYNSYTEATKEEISDKAITKLFNQIKNKTIGLDFKDFEASKGDVTKIEEYAFVFCSSLTSFCGKYASEDGRCLIIGGTLNIYSFKFIFIANMFKMPFCIIF